MSDTSRDRDTATKAKEDAYFLMLKVTREKEILPAKWSLSNLDEESAALVIDELDEQLYLWIGQSVDGVTKAIARRKAADISSQGYKIANIPYPIGKVAGKKLELIEIDQGDLAKSHQAKEAFNSLKTLFRRKTELLEGDVLARAGVKIPKAMRELGDAITRPPAKFDEVSKALEEKFGKAPEIIAERETMRGRYREREDEKVAAVHILALLELLGGKGNVEIKIEDDAKVYHVTKPAATETEQERILVFTIEGKKLRVIGGNLSQEDVNKMMRRVEELL